MKILHIDLLNSGISGDMFLAGLLGLVPEPNEILLELKELKNYFPDISKAQILKLADGFISTSPNRDSALEAIVALLQAGVPHYDWAGIYILEDDGVLSLGPYRGDPTSTPRAQIDRGICGAAVRQKKTIIVPDVEKFPGHIACDSRSRSEIVVPLRSKNGQVIGVLDVQSDRPFAYSQADVAIFQSLADQASVAIENARLFEQVRSHAIERATLNKLGQALTARLDVEEVLDEAYRQASRLLDTTNFYVGLYDPGKDEIAFLLDTAESETEREITTIPASQGINGYIVRSRTSVLIRENVLERLTEMGVELTGELPFSWLGVPLIVGDRVLGVMGVQSFAASHAYDEHDRDLLTAIASSTPRCRTRLKLSFCPKQPKSGKQFRSGLRMISSWTFMWKAAAFRLKRFSKVS